jgi:hypothetical protein
MDARNGCGHDGTYIRHGRACLHSDLFRVSRPSNPVACACEADSVWMPATRAGMTKSAEHRLSERG